MVGWQIVVYSILVFFTHLTILTGQFGFSGRSNKAENQPAPSLRFFGLVFVFVWLPCFAALFVGAFVFGSRFGNAPLYISALVSVWVSLTVFGKSIPRHVWVQVNGGDEKTNHKGRPVWVYVGTRLLLWNTVYYALFLVLLVALNWLTSSELGAIIPFFQIGTAVILEAFSYVAIVMTAAVLFHAHLRSHNLGPQGLIEQP